MPDANVPNTTVSSVIPVSPTGVLPNVSVSTSSLGGTSSPSFSEGVKQEAILDLLLADHTISQVQYDDIKVRSASQNKTIEDTLKEMNIVQKGKIAEVHAKLLGVPFINLANTSFSPQAVSLLSSGVVQRFQAIQFAYDDKAKILSIAMANPIDLNAQQFIQQKTGLTIKTFAAAPSDVSRAIQTQYRQELVGEVGKAVKETEELTVTKTVDSKKISEIIKEAPIAKIVATILEYAVTSRASDVHIEPFEDRMRVRYRIDGILYDKLSLPKAVQDAVVSRIKVLSEMKIDEHRTPQDGRFNFKVEDKEVDLRISVLPTVHGEKVVMRLLRKSGGVPTFAELGLGGVGLKNLETAMLRPHGIIIVCGPTGSGKTTTLYSVLAKLNTTRVNIVSLEDPVEYEMPGINQVQINDAVGLTFAARLRSVLRHDPNIILVGEIRDKETTDLAIQAALTGHLVFSTLHTSDAAGALPRLLDMGAEPFLITSSVTAIVAQRVLRKIDENGKVAYDPDPKILQQIKDNLGPLFPQATTAVKLYHGAPTAENNNSGYLGRIGIFEVLTITDKISKLILGRAPANEIEVEAKKEGMIGLKEDGFLKVLDGLTSIEEVLRVAEE